MSPFNLETCARPNILRLQPYRCARDDYKDDGHNILLDANENAYGPPISQQASAALQDGNAARLDLLGLHRYPDPHQHALKQQLCELRGTGAHTAQRLTPDNLFVGVGSDEAIDALLRCFCVPGRDPGLPAHLRHFQLDVPAILAALDDAEANHVKLIYLCSPGNPTGSLLAKEDVRRVLEHPTWNGIVVLDEAYVDFAGSEKGEASLAEWVNEWPNLVVMQTLSKAFGMAGIRLGAAFCAPPVARMLNSLKAPYNVSSPTSALASYALSAEGLAAMRENRSRLVAQRDRLIAELPKIPGVGRLRGGTESNFLLYEMVNANGEPDNKTALAVYEGLAETKGVVVRFRGKEHGCLGCLRITVGTEVEVTRFLESIRKTLAEVRGTETPSDEERREKEASGVVA
ncbi:hypothetical protein INS49_000823 [Diaporthe citri]|uniref:uncharacterized protein n=1 Tax=Diaporthe citri TaxID=83186 RepID=UPI001C816BB2|nr:uncharacterized protein INS49_000823 [Diaporthe citri]KAG6366644.1 hypothetical protein INS49_000823 [Diaporthe citri]